MPFKSRDGLVGRVGAQIGIVWVHGGRIAQMDARLSMQREDDLRG